MAKMAGASMAIWPQAREACPDEQMEELLRRHLAQSNPGITNISLDWLWQAATTWTDEDGGQNHVPAHWVLFGEGEVSAATALASGHDPQP